MVEVTLLVCCCGVAIAVLCYVRTNTTNAVDQIRAIDFLCLYQLKMFIEVLIEVEFGRIGQRHREEYYRVCKQDVVGEVT